MKIESEILTLLKKDVPISYILDKYTSKGYNVQNIHDMIEANMLILSRIKNKKVLYSSLLKKYKQVTDSFVLSSFNVIFLNILLYFLSFSIKSIIIFNFIFILNHNTISYLSAYFLKHEVQIKNLRIILGLKILVFLLFLISLYNNSILLCGILLLFLNLILNLSSLYESSKPSISSQSNISSKYLTMFNGVFFLIFGLIFKYNEMVFINGNYVLNNYFIIFSISFILTIISSIISLVNFKSNIFKKKYKLGLFLKIYYRDFFKKIRFNLTFTLSLLYFVDGMLMLIKTALFAVVPIFLYFEFQKLGSPMFIISVIMLIGSFISIVSVNITNILSRFTSIIPLLIFGTLLISIFPLILISNLFLYAIVVAYCLFVIGLNMVEVGKGIFISSFYNYAEKTFYYNTTKFVSLFITFCVLTFFILFSNTNMSDILNILFYMVVVILFPTFIILLFKQHKHLSPR